MTFHNHLQGTQTKIDQSKGIKQEIIGQSSLSFYYWPSNLIVFKDMFLMGSRATCV